MVEAVAVVMQLRGWVLMHPLGAQVSLVGEVAGWSRAWMRREEMLSLAVGDCLSLFAGAGAAADNGGGGCLSLLAGTGGAAVTGGGGWLSLAGEGGLAARIAGVGAGTAGMTGGLCGGRAVGGGAIEIGVTGG